MKARTEAKASQIRGAEMRAPACPPNERLCLRRLSIARDKRLQLVDLVGVDERFDQMVASIEFIGVVVRFVEGRGGARVSHQLQSLLVPPLAQRQPSEAKARIALC